MKQVVIIFSAMILGVIFYQGYQFTWLVRYSVMVMLFLAFLRVDFSLGVLRWTHLWVVLGILILPLAIFFLLRPFGIDLALSCFVIAMAPTAAGAPVIAAFLRSEVAYVTASVIFTTPVVGLVLPVVLPQIIPVAEALRVGEVMGPTAILVFGPLLASQLLRRGRPRWLPFFDRLRDVPFYLFITNIFIASGKASHFIRFEAEISWDHLAILATAVVATGLLLFKVGEKMIGRRDFPIENGLAIGRKNTMFALWVSLTFLSPLVALGPIFYIFFQNSYNGWQLYRLNKIEKVKP
jgi:BASS family bile acid:Na+ symporter